LYDLHGVSGCLPEKNTEQIDQWLQHMDQLIREYTKEFPGLAKALRVDAQYVRQERLKFLRADEYDPVKAAERMGHYFDMKQEYFCGSKSAKGQGHGEECSCISRDLTIYDLSEEDLNYWRTGFYQVCREKDSAGRIVCIVFLELCYRLQIPAESMVRVYLVMNSVLTKGVDVQMSGNVHIAHAVGLGEDSLKFIGSDHFANSIIKAGRWAPLRGVAKHFCYDHESLHPMFGKYALPMATFNAVRFRSHFGTNSEILYNLMTFGISTDSLPVSNEGMVDTTFHNGFIDSLLRQHQVQEQQPSSHEVDMRKGNRDVEQMMSMPETQIVFDESQVGNGPVSQVETGSDDCTRRTKTPVLVEETVTGVIFALKPMDVILGRGPHNKTNPGNLRLKLLLEDHYEEYNASTNRANKTFLVASLAKQMQDAGSRFVYAAEESESVEETLYRRWFLASEERIRDKITHDFRNMRRAEGNSNKKTMQKMERTKRLVTCMDDFFASSTIQGPPSSLTHRIDSISSRPTDDCSENIVLNPRDTDILMGRNKKKSNPGNMMLRDAVEEFYIEYEAANEETGATANAEKLAVVEKVLKRMYERGARFLVFQSEGFWLPAAPEKVHDKITQDFRNLRWAKKNKN
jgi:hypothetical protein